MHLKKTFILAAFIAVLLPSLGFPASSKHKVLFEKAKFTMETKGDLKGAIKLFNEIIEKYPNEREYAAKSQLYIGLCYEKSGLKEAQKAYRKVIDSYPEQVEAVKVANEKLSLLLRAEAVIRKEDKEFNIRKVWTGPNVDFMGAISPDGRYLSYVDWDTGDLAIYELATGKKRRLTNKGSWDESDEFAEFSRWSPDGKQIVYDWYNKKDFVDLCIIGLDGSKPRILYSNEEVEWAQTYDWSPDGKQILAFFWRKDDINKIVLVSAADGSVRILKTLDKYWPQNMCFSPDGRYIVYDFPQKEDSAERDILLLTSDGSYEISLVEHPANDFVLGWAPDGKNILFASDRARTLGAWLIAVADGKPQGAPELVKPDIGRFQPMGFTQKGSFYYGISQKCDDIYIAELDPETGEILASPKRPITRFVGHNQTPDYSPDGKYLAYISRRPLTISQGSSDGGNVLCIKSLETGQEREVLPALNRFGWPRWSPDGRSVLVVDWKVNNQMGYYQIDTQTGNVTPLVPPAEDIRLFGRHEWSCGGKTIFYPVHISYKPLLFKILVRDLETGTEKELFQTSSDHYRDISLSPDGQWLALRGRSKGKGFLKVMPVTGGKPRELCRFGKRSDDAGIAITWTTDGKYILFSRKRPGQDDSKLDLYRIHVEGGEPVKLGLEMIQFFNLSVHPDGKHIAFSSPGSTTKFAEVWVMENFLPE